MRIDSGSSTQRVHQPAPEPKPPEAKPPEATNTAAQPRTVRDGFDGATAAAAGGAAGAAAVGKAAAAGVAAAAKTPPPPAVPQAALDKLPAADKARVQELANGKEGATSQRNLGTLVDSAGFKALPAESQAKALQTFLASPPSSETSTRHLTTLVNSPNFRALPAADQAKALDVFKNTDVNGRQNLIDLTNRQVNGKSALLDKDKNGNTLLSSLHSMATGPISGDFAKNGVTRADMLSTVMQEAAKPGQINQDGHNTCTVTSMQYMLNQSNPAEYVRIMQGLTSPSGQVQLRNGATLTREADAIAPDSSTSRSATERLFQSAMMEYSNGGHAYSNVTDKSTGNDKILGIFDNKKEYQGLYKDQEERGMEALFGRDVNVYSGHLNFTDDKQDIVNALSSRNNQRALMDLSWGTGGHAVVFEKIENGRVYFRNPWGPTGDANGTNYGSPPRRLEDNANRIESMSIEDFKKHVRQVYLPN